MSFKSLAFPVFAVAVAGILVALIQPAYVAERWSPLTVRAPIADPAPEAQPDWTTGESQQP